MLVSEVHVVGQDPIPLPDLLDYGHIVSPFRVTACSITCGASSLQEGLDGSRRHEDNTAPSLPVRTDARAPVRTMS